MRGVRKCRLQMMCVLQMRGSHLFISQLGWFRGSKYGSRWNRPMHAGMQPREKGGAGLPPPRLRSQPGAPATWWAPPGHRLHMACSLLDLLCCFGYDWVQFDVEGELLVYFWLRTCEFVFCKLRFLYFIVFFHLSHYKSCKTKYHGTSGTMSIAKAYVI